MNKVNRSQTMILDEMNGDEYTISSLASSLKGRLHPNTIRCQLDKLESKGIVVVTRRTAPGGELHYKRAG